jgi:hypothetical protein
MKQRKASLKITTAAHESQNQTIALPHFPVCSTPTYQSDCISNHVKQQSTIRYSLDLIAPFRCVASCWFSGGYLDLDPGVFLRCKNV